VQIAFVVEGQAGHLHQAGPDPISHVGRRPMGDLDRQASVLLAGDVKPNIMSCRSACASRPCRATPWRIGYCGRCGDGRREAVVIAAVVVLFGLHLLYQQQRAASLVLRPPAQAASA
jgi:hypothetical protein